VGFGRVAHDRVALECDEAGGSLRETSAGLDRIDSAITYTDANTVPCCFGCNAWKKDIHTYQETMDRFKPMRDAMSNKIDVTPADFVDEIAA
jgi:hypothetical protein